MTNNYTDIFGGTAVSASNPSYSTVTLSANTTYTWPGTIDGSNPLADIMNVTATVGSLKFIMPPGNQGSTGSSVLFVNKGANSFQVVANDGVTAIVTITAGQGVYVYLTNNSTANGTFNTVGLGTGTSSPDAASLAGFGLMVTATTLNTAYPVTTQSSNYAVLSSDRAKLLTWTGGAGSFTLSLASTMGNNFFFLASNQGTGALSITPTAPDAIDGSTPSIAINPGESCFVVCSGSTWYTVGRGRANQFVYSLLSKNVAGSSDVTLTTAEAANLIHTYFGVLTGNISVIVPGIIQQYTVYNNTSGAFTLTVKVSGGTGVVVPQGFRYIVYFDGSDIVVSNTASTGTVSSIGITPPSAGITVSGSPVTSAGSITLALANDLAALENLSGTGYANRTGTSTWTVSNNISVGTLAASSTVTFTGGEGTVGIPAVQPGLTVAIAGNTLSSGATAVRAGQTIAATTTSVYRGFSVESSTAAASFNVNTVENFYSGYSTLGAGSSVGSISGYLAASSLANAAATNTYGFYGNVASGSGRWNFYANGTANNAFSGNTRFGSTTAPTVAVDVTGTVAASTSMTIAGNTVATLNDIMGRNRIINGDMYTAQRASSATVTAGTAVPTASTGYPTIDRWFVYSTGANVVAASVVVSSINRVVNQVTGAASVTAVGIGQRIESANCYDMAGTTCTLSAYIANSLLTTVTWTASYATTNNTFGTIGTPTKTQIATGTFTVTSTLTQYTASFSVPAAAVTGIEILFTVGAQTSGTWQVADVQFETGAVATPFERLSYGTQFAQCQRYYQYYNNGVINGYQTAGGTQWGYVMLPVVMFAAPSASIVGAATSNCSTPIIQTSTVSSLNITTIVTATGAGFSSFQIVLASEVP